MRIPVGISGNGVESLASCTAILSEAPERRPEGTTFSALELYSDTVEATPEFAIAGSGFDSTGVLIGFTSNLGGGDVTPEMATKLRSEEVSRARSTRLPTLTALEMRPASSLDSVAGAVVPPNSSR